MVGVIVGIESATFNLDLTEDVPKEDYIDCHIPVLTVQFILYFNNFKLFMVVDSFECFLKMARVFYSDPCSHHVSNSKRVILVFSNLLGNPSQVAFNQAIDSSIVCIT